MKGTILILDDEELMLDYLNSELTKNDFEVHVFQSPAEGLKALDDISADLVLTDVKMPEMTGDDVLNHIHEHHPDVGVMLMTGFGSIEHAVNAIQKGAFDYVTKPFDGAEMLARIQRFFKHKEQTGTVTHSGSEHQFAEPKEVGRESKPATKSKKAGKTQSLKLIGDHPKVKQLLESLPIIARNDAPVFIQGESGTGKEVFASLIHYNSDRSDKPYVKINCANLPRELVESTLFGHVKGSFTGAIKDAKGAFDEAEKGTLLLDEITEIDIAVQAKLLRVLQEKEFQRVGAQKPVKTNVRIIATSNKKVGKAIKDGSFREDLYYRLNVFPISIPPLRERKEDIIKLARYFVEKYIHEYGMDDKEISPDLEKYLRENNWPGNVRELHNMIQRGVLMSGKSDHITVEHIRNGLFSNLDEEMKKSETGDLPLIPVDEMELILIQKALDKTGGNQKEAAELLGISDRTIRNKLKKLRQQEENSDS